MFDLKYSTILVFVVLSFSSLTISCQQQQIKNSEKANKPEENRFTKVVLAENLDEPMQFKILKDGRVLIAERKGKIKVFNPDTKEMTVIADIPVSTGYYSLTGEEISPFGEDGMQGAILDPNFDQNNWIYLYYSPKGGAPKTILVRYEWKGETINSNSGKILFEVPNQRESCCHLGGGMLFDSDGNLLLSTGDNTPNDPQGYSPLDERSGNSRHDAQRTAANSNDLRGKILRIRPETDGSYSIPEGNLFPKGTPKTKPEIYTMGNRNPWRLSIDSKTGWLYWGEVGPHGIADSTGRGPRSYDEFNQARTAGNYGWPYFVADNKAYWDFDYATGKSGEKFDPDNPVNNSPNNTGVADLLPARPAFIWYPQSQAVDFPLLGSGSNSAVGGPIYRRSDFENPERPFPSYYDGKWLITDWTRGWIMAVSFDENGDFKSMEQFLPNLDLKGAIDLNFGPVGDLYILEYGRGPYRYNPEAQLVRIEYNDGNRKPIVAVSADKYAGAVPMQVHLSSAGTIDHDNDHLTYQWKIISEGKKLQILNEPDPKVTLAEPGIYQATLTVTDSEGAKDSSAIEIYAGNEPPMVKFDLKGANRSFFFSGETIKYSVQVNDKEDGSLADHTISPSQVSVRIDYLAYGQDIAEIYKNLKQVDALVSLQSVLANQLINNSDCRSCHTMDIKTYVPAYTDIAKKYKADANAQAYLTKKIISGGGGVWGDLAMPPHPTIAENEANIIAKYILDLEEQSALKSLSVNGTFTTKIPDGSNSGSIFGPSFSDKFIFRASYTDKGTEVAPKQSFTDILVLRNPVVPVIQADNFEGLNFNHEINVNRTTVTPKDSDSYLVLNKIDLTGIRDIEFAISAIPDVSSTSGGVIEIRIDSSTGKVIGQTNEINLAKNSAGKIIPQVKTDVMSINNKHDVYFLFKNIKEGDAINQIQLREIKFKNNEMKVL